LKIGWLQDFNIFSVQGGAEMNDAMHFKEGLSRKHRITLFTSDSAFEEQDCIIISNCVTFDRFRLRNIVNSTPNIVFFFHDYIFCRFRLFYPVAEICKSCGYKNYWLELFKKAKLLIWLSPLHREATLASLPELAEKKFALIPSAIDPDLFLMMKPKERHPAYLSVNTLYEFKGKENLLRWARENPKETLHILSQAECYEQFPENVTVLPSLPYEKMPELYANYEYYIELPNTPQPFNRTCAEAKLSGCKILTNKLMGCASWDWFGNPDLNVIAEELKAAPKRFWEAIEERIK